MSKKKKIITGLFVLCLVVVGGFAMTRAHMAKAVSIFPLQLLKSINILGLSVVQTGSVMFYAADITDATSTQYVDLPDLTGNHGLIYFVKRIGSANENYTLIRPASGDSIQYTSDYALFNTGDYAILFGDAENSNWWVLNSTQ